MSERIRHDRAGLHRLEARLGIDGAVRFFDAVAVPAEEYELGLAVGHGGGRENVLVSYNPRTRRGDFRERSLVALEAAGLDVEPVRDLYRRVGPLDSSTVVGLEWERGGGLSATVYVEEITRFLGAEGAERVTREWADDHGQPLSIPESPGELYILAVDLPGPVLKVYRLHFEPPSDLLASLGIDDPEILEPGAVAWIEQWHLPSGRLKLYRCYDYGAGDDDPVEAESLYGAGGPWSEALLRDLDAIMERRVRVTSVGHRYGEPKVSVLYWCASGPGVP